MGVIAWLTTHWHHWYGQYVAAVGDRVVVACCRNHLSRPYFQSANINRQSLGLWGPSGLLGLHHSLALCSPSLPTQHLPSHACLFTSLLGCSSKMLAGFPLHSWLSVWKAVAQFIQLLRCRSRRKKAAYLFTLSYKFIPFEAIQKAIFHI